MSGVNVYISSDNDIHVKGLKIASTGAFANAATVVASIIDSAGSAVSGSTVTLDYITNSNGNYFKAIPSSVVMTKGLTYDLQVTATQGGADITIRKPFVAGYYQGGEC